MTDRDKRLEEIKREYAINARYGKFVSIKVEDAGWLLEEIERLQQEADFEGAIADDSNADLNEAMAENERLREERDDFKHGHIMQQAEIKRLREALEWYADKDKHEIKRRVGGDFAPIVLDRGDIARAALRIGDES